MKLQTSNPNQTNPARGIPAPPPHSLRVSGFGFGISPVPARAAFSFAEVMFAVVILGIGFIMIAAIFPVAIQQSQSTTDESIAASIARGAANLSSSLPTTFRNPLYDAGTALPPSKFPDDPQYLTLFPPTVKSYSGLTPPAVVVPFSGPRWDAIKNSLILPSDPRYAYVPFYRRESGSNFMQLIVLAVAVRNRSNYDPTVDSVFNPSVAAQISSVTATFNITNTVAGYSQLPTTFYPDTVQITSGSPQPGYFLSVTRTGTDSAGNDVTDVRTYRIGRMILPAPRTYELEPPDDLRRTAGFQTVTGTTGTPDGLWGTWDDIRDTLNPTDKNTPPTNTGYSTLVNANPILIPSTTLQPLPLWVQLTFPSDSIAGRATLYYMQPGANGLIPASDIAAPGAFIVIGDDYPYRPANYVPGTGTDNANGSFQVDPATLTYTTGGGAAGAATLTATAGQSNGRIYRLGAPVPSQPGSFDLDPNWGMAAPATNAYQNSVDQLPLSPITPVAPNTVQTPGPLAKAYIVGVGRTDPKTAIGGSYSGSAQDVAVYTTFIQAQ